MSILKGLLQNEEFLIGAGLLQSGSMGQNIGQSIFPALTQAGKTQAIFANAEAESKKRDAFNKLLESDEISDINKLYLAAGITPPKTQDKAFKPDVMYKEGKTFDVDLNNPNSKVIIQEKLADGWSFNNPEKPKGKNFRTLYHKDGDRVDIDINNPGEETKLDFYLSNNYSFAPFKDKPKKTISDEALRIYENLKAAPNFDEAFAKLTQPEKELYIKQIKGNIPLAEQLIEMAMKNNSNTNKNEIDFKNYNTTTNALKQFGENITVEQLFNAFKKENPNLTDQQLINALIENNFIVGG